jgi:adenylylsulfate kinase
MPKGVLPGFVIWLTGLPSSGKTVLAHAVSDQLLKRDIRVQILDSDNLRQKLTPNPSYSPQERDWFYEVVIFLAGVLTDNGVNVLVAATASRRAYRETARARIGQFAEVYVDCSPEVCRTRDPKGLWRSAEKGEIRTLPGAGTSYEPPDAPEVRVDTTCLSVDDSALQILHELDRQGFFPQ